MIVLMMKMMKILMRIKQSLLFSFKVSSQVSLKILLLNNVFITDVVTLLKYVFVIVYAILLQVCPPALLYRSLLNTIYNASEWCIYLLHSQQLFAASPHTFEPMKLFEIVLGFLIAVCEFKGLMNVTVPYEYTVYVNINIFSTEINRRISVGQKKKGKKAGSGSSTSSSSRSDTPTKGIETTDKTVVDAAKKLKEISSPGKTE